MTYREERRVILPNGLFATEVRTLDDGDVSYHYEQWGMKLIYLRGWNVEYNGQILDAYEPKGQEDE